MILSHHGQLEFGSPKVPQFPEALLLHYLDDMDSKMECMRALIENDRQADRQLHRLERPAGARGAQEGPLSERKAPAPPPAAPAPPPRRAGPGGRPATRLLPAS